MYLAHGINVEHRCSCDRLKLASEIDEHLRNKRSCLSVYDDRSRNAKYR